MTQGLILIIVSAVLLISPFALPCSAYAPVSSYLFNYNKISSSTQTVIMLVWVLHPAPIDLDQVPAALTFAGRSAAAAAVGTGIGVTGAGGVLGTGLAANLTKEEFFTADGVINLDTHVNFIGRCVASSSHREAFRREFLKGAKDCGLDVKSLARRRRSPILNGGLLDPFKLAVTKTKILSNFYK